MKELLKMMESYTENRLLDQYYGQRLNVKNEVSLEEDISYAIKEFFKYDINIQVRGEIDKRSRGQIFKNVTGFRVTLIQREDSITKISKDSLGQLIFLLLTLRTFERENYRMKSFLLSTIENIAVNMINGERVEELESNFPSVLYVLATHYNEDEMKKHRVVKKLKRTFNWTDEDVLQFIDIAYTEMQKVKTIFEKNTMVK